MRSICAAAALALAVPTLALAGADTTLERTEALFAALESGNLETIEGMMTEEVVTTIPYSATGVTTEDAFRVFDGRPAVMAYFAGAIEFIPEVTFVTPVITVSEDGNTAFVETRGDMRLADGRPYANIYVWRLDYSEGRIAAITEYFNPVTAAIAFNRPIGPQPTQ